ncbi:MAG: hypothetical protein WEG36_11100 [Gemmatimonadota bacterium]
MAAAPIVFSHWYQLIEGLQASPMEFYSSVENAVGRRELPDTKLGRVDWKEGGVFSAKREYLRARRREYIFDICGAPFGDGFFISWWLGEKPSGLLALVLMIPFVGVWIRRFLKPVTYYQIDTALMFQTAIHGAVIEVLDGLTTARGLRALTELERRPIQREYFQR